MKNILILCAFLFIVSCNQDSNNKVESNENNPETLATSNEDLTNDVTAGEGENAEETMEAEDEDTYIAPEGDSEEVFNKLVEEILQKHNKMNLPEKTQDFFLGVDLENLKNKKPPKSIQEIASYAMAFEFTSNIVRDSVPLDYEYFLLGMLNAVKNNYEYFDPKEMALAQEEFQEFMLAHEEKIKQRQDQRLKEMFDKNEAIKDEYLEEFRSQDDVKTIDYKIFYRVLAKGDGPKPGPDDYVKFEFIATDPYGNEILNTMRTGRNVSQIKRLIGGEQAMLMNMRPGDVWDAIVQPSLAAMQLPQNPVFPPNTIFRYRIHFIGYPTMEEIVEFNKIMATEQRRQSGNLLGR